MSPAIKRALFRDGRYVFRAPGVCTYYWDADDWIKWIDAGKGWRPQQP